VNRKHFSSNGKIQGENCSVAEQSGEARLHKNKIFAFAYFQ
jgi:hypothetical protein